MPSTATAARLLGIFSAMMVLRTMMLVVFPAVCATARIPPGALPAVLPATLLFVNTNWPRVVRMPLASPALWLLTVLFTTSNESALLPSKNMPASSPVDTLALKVEPAKTPPESARNMPPPSAAALPVTCTPESESRLRLRIPPPKSLVRPLLMVNPLMRTPSATPPGISKTRNSVTAVRARRTVSNCALGPSMEMLRVITGSAVARSMFCCVLTSAEKLIRSPSCATLIASRNVQFAKSQMPSLVSAVELTVRVVPTVVTVSDAAATVPGSPFQPSSKRKRHRPLAGLPTNAVFMLVT